MFKIIKADKDTYVTNKVVNGERSHNANVGIASSLDLFKLYGNTFSGSSPNFELSRLLLHFDLTSLSDLLSSGKIDISHPSFFAKLQLFDVYGGQPTPERFTLSVNPLSKSFDEGAGRDVVYYQDRDTANFLTASYESGDVKWIDEGCGKSGSVGSACDFFTGSIATFQFFKTGEENLDVDVTPMISGVLTGLLPDAGFRISYSTQEEANYQTYFVKRFASRHAYDETKHPRLFVGYDDSFQDRTQGMTFDSSTPVFFFNYDKGEPKNLSTGVGELTGNDCLLLKMHLNLSGTSHDFYFSASQYKTGIYSASIYLSSSNQYIHSATLQSGSTLKFTPVWSSTDESIAFQTGSAIKVSSPTRGLRNISPKKFAVSIYGLSSVHRSNETPTLRVSIFDYTSPMIMLAKTPVNSPDSFQGVVSDAFYSVRDAVTQQVIVPFDTTKGSTRISSDGEGLFFKLDMSNFVTERTYVIDLMIKVGGEYQHYAGASPVFKVSNTQ